MDGALKGGKAGGRPAWVGGSRPHRSSSGGGGGAAAPGSKDKVKAVQSQVDEVVDVMKNNISKAIDRGEKLDQLQTKTDDLQNQANQFKRGSTKLRKAMYCKNVKLQLMIGGVCLVIIAIIIIIIVMTTKK